MSLSDKKFELLGYDDFLFEIKDVKEAVKKLKENIDKSLIEDVTKCDHIKEGHILEKIDKIFGKDLI